MLLDSENSGNSNIMAPTSTKNLVQQSKRREKKVYIYFMCVGLFSCSLFYYGVIRKYLDNPEQERFKDQPIKLIAFVTCCYGFFCALMVALYITAFPLVTSCWSHVRVYCPIKIKRRTFCFCNFARRRLVKILLSIHGTQCKWQPQNPDNLDEKTRNCIILIKNETCATLECDKLDYMLVGSSAEGLGKSYILDLKNSYRDQWCRFLLRFFCCCLPCNTSFSCLRTDIDVLLRYTNEEKAQNSDGKLPLRRSGRKLRSADKVSSSAHDLTLFNLDDCPNKPGFVRVILNQSTREEFIKPWEAFCNLVNGRMFLSSALIRKAVFESVNSVDESSLPASRIFGPFKHPPHIELDMKGPAVKLTLYPIGQAWYWNENQKFVIFEADLVFGIHCHQKWPPCAQKWLSRPRFWPSKADVQHVTNSGYILVAKSSKTLPSMDDDLEWLVSFPHCETYLGQRIPQVAKACYLALKIIFKDHLSYICEDLKTYQLKTVLFWELEKHPLKLWDIENIENSFLCLLDSLIDCVWHKDCPSFWIENHNLFRGCDRYELAEVLAALRKIRSNPAPYIEDLGSMWC